MRAILNMIKARNSPKRSILWINLREEPVIFINNVPYLLREYENPFRNMSDFEGIESNRLAEIEKRLKADILKEASENNNNILVHDEEDGGIVPYFCSCSKYTVQTPSEVVHMLQNEGYSLNIIRVPVTAESYFDYNDVDTIMQLYIQSYLSKGKNNIIFNCQMGGGRSTVAMVLVSLIQAALQSQKEIIKLTRTHSNPILFQAKSKQQEQQTGLSLMKKGAFPLITKLLRLLREGKKSKDIVDEIIDRCGRVHHLREAIIEKFLKTSKSTDSEEDTAMLDNSKGALMRYYNLICFQNYLQRSMNTIQNRRKELEIDSKEIKTSIAQDLLQYVKQFGFQKWMDKHSELQRLAKVFEEEPVIFPNLDISDNQSKVESYVKHRKGSVLSTNMMVLYEHSNNSELNNTTGQNNLDAGLNDVFYRHLEILPIAITSQTSLKETKYVLDQVQTVDTPNLYSELETESPKSSSRQQILWINVREEPVIYIKGHPCVVRHYQRPFRTLKEFTHTGVTAERTEDVEKRFKKDILAELEQNDGKLLVHHVHSNELLDAKWMFVSPFQVLTCQEFYNHIKNELNYNVDYHRVPLQVENYLSMNAFDVFFKLLLSKQKAGVTTIINCQRGGRRSSVGMIMACLTYMHVGVFEVKVKDEFEDSILSSTDENSHSDDDIDDNHKNVSELLAKRKQSVKDLKRVKSNLEMPLITLDVTDVSDIESDIDEQVMVNTAQSTTTSKGEFRGIISLLRILRNGRQMKRQVDAIIDICGDIYNVRDRIISQVNEIQNVRQSKRRKFLETSSVRHLVSYAYLIVFATYLNHRRSNMIKDISLEYELKTHENFLEESQTLYAKKKRAKLFQSLCNDSIELFENWVNKRNELLRELQHLVEKPHQSLQLVLDGEISADMLAVATKRNGQVLLRTSILKSDYFKGCKNKNIKQYINGTINFRALEHFNLRVAGTGIPTKIGIKNILDYLLTGKIKIKQNTFISNNNDQWDSSTEDDEEEEDGNESNIKSFESHLTTKSLLWLDMREEPYMYIEGSPFCLRNYDAPYKNLEHTGITRIRLEAMESRLLNDVKNECQKFNGQLLLHDENENGGLKGVWKENLTDVKTAKSLFEDIFNQAKIPATYYRTPITDERAPQPEAVDELISYLEQGENLENRFIVFNCQMGRGRTTTAMVIASLWSVHRLNIKINFNKQIKEHIGWAPDLNNTKKDELLLMDEKLQQRLQSGNWKIIRKLVRLLPDGELVKKEVDDIIDICSAMQNLRTAIFDVQNVALTTLPRKRPSFERLGKCYLQRYFYVIVLNAYLRQEASKSFEISFKKWLNTRSEITNLLPYNSIQNLIFPELS